MLPKKDKIFHIGLTGDIVTNDMDLVRQLKMYHHVTLIKQEHLLFDKSIIQSLSVLIMDCNNTNNPDLEMFSDLKVWKKDFPRLNIVLINGGLSQEEIAAAFKVGIRDYFSDPYDINLLIERIQYLRYT